MCYTTLHYTMLRGDKYKKDAQIECERGLVTMLNWQKTSRIRIDTSNIGTFTCMSYFECFSVTVSATYCLNPKLRLCFCAKLGMLYINENENRSA